MSDKINPVKISKKAITKIRHIMQQKNISDQYGLRMGIKSAGCSIGNSYLIGFDKKKNTDIEYFQGGIRIYIEKKHVMYLVGLEVDFQIESDISGFAFIKSKVRK